MITILDSIWALNETTLTKFCHQDGVYIGNKADLKIVKRNFVQFAIHHANASATVHSCWQAFVIEHKRLNQIKADKDRKWA